MIIANVVSTESGMVKDLKLINKVQKKDTKTMKDIVIYSREVTHLTNKDLYFSVAGNLYVMFFTNNKGNRSYKFFTEVELNDMTTGQTITLKKKKQIRPARELEFNDTDFIAARGIDDCCLNIAMEYNKIMDKLKQNK